MVKQLRPSLIASAFLAGLAVNTAAADDLDSIINEALTPYELVIWAGMASVWHDCGFPKQAGMVDEFLDFAQAECVRLGELSADESKEADVFRRYMLNTDNVCESAADQAGMSRIEYVQDLEVQLTNVSLEDILKHRRSAFSPKQQCSGFRGVTVNSN